MSHNCPPGSEGRMLRWVRRVPSKGTRWVLPRTSTSRHQEFINFALNFMALMGHFELDERMRKCTPGTLRLKQTNGPLCDDWVAASPGWLCIVCYKADRRRIANCNNVRARRRKSCDDCTDWRRRQTFANPNACNSMLSFSVDLWALATVTAQPIGRNSHSERENRLPSALMD